MQPYLTHSTWPTAAAAGAMYSQSSNVECWKTLAQLLENLSSGAGDMSEVQTDVMELGQSLQDSPRDSPYILETTWRHLTAYDVSSSLHSRP